MPTHVRLRAEGCAPRRWYGETGPQTVSARTRKPPVGVPNKGWLRLMASPAFRSKAVGPSDQSDRPEVACEIRVNEVRVGQGEVASLAPVRPPGIADEEAPACVGVADCHDGVSAEHLLARRGKRSITRLRHIRTLKALVDREPQYEREACGQASLELSQRLRDSHVRDRAIELFLTEACRGRHAREP